MDQKEQDKAQKKQRITLILVSTLITLAIVFVFQTDAVTSLTDNVKSFFVKEKEITQSIEGQEEKTDVSLKEGVHAEYIIYIDESRYEMKNKKDVDVITPIASVPEGYPEVSMEITQLPNLAPEDYVKELENELKAEFPELREIEEVTEPVNGFLLHGAAGNKANSQIVHAYVISNGKEGSFVITEYYFLEAAEGHGARFHHMLESFEIVE